MFDGKNQKHFEGVKKINHTYSILIRKLPDVHNRRCENEGPKT